MCEMELTKNIVIRPARLGDIEEIIRLCGEHAEYEKASYSAEGKAEKLAGFLFGEQPRLFCLIAEKIVEKQDAKKTREIVGYATYMQEFSTWDAGLFIHMDCLFLRPEARSAGIGEKLVHVIVEHAQTLGCEQIQWQTPEWNERAIKFDYRIGATSKPKLRMYLDVLKHHVLSSAFLPQS
jgi:ribosomal protein S18 acetylase RimI-like enzyme